MLNKGICKYKMQNKEVFTALELPSWSGQIWGVGGG